MVFLPDVEFTAQVEEIARAGSDRLLEYWRRLEPGQIDEKARNDLVTDADRASEAAILAEVARRYPDHSVLSEEAGWSRRAGEAPTWLVDPLDGTANFVHGFPHFAVSVGVAVGGRLVSGVVIDPVKGDVFRATRGAGATWNGRPCRVNRRPSLEGSLIATGFPFRAHRLLEPYLAIFHDVFLGCTGIRRPGAAALDLAYTACGIFDGFFEFRLSPWDVAAGTLLVEEAGGTVTDMDGGEGFLATGDILSGSPGVHQDLLEIVRRHRPAWAGAVEG